MNYIEKNPKLFEYYLIENDKSTDNVYKLTLKEVKVKNYAYAINRSNKRFVLVSEMPNDIEKTIIILPEGT
jgi:hypothetical protein